MAAQKRLIDYPAVYRSKKLARLSEADRLDYVWYYGMAQGNGVFEADAQLVWQESSHMRASHTAGSVAALLDRLDDAKLLFRWRDERSGKVLGYWAGNEKKGRRPAPSQMGRLDFPSPPKELYEKWLVSRGKPGPQRTLRFQARGARGEGTTRGRGAASGKAIGYELPRQSLGSGQEAASAGLGGVGVGLGKEQEGVGVGLGARSVKAAPRDGAHSVNAAPQDSLPAPPASQSPQAALAPLAAPSAPALPAARAEKEKATAKPETETEKKSETEKATAGTSPENGEEVKPTGAAESFFSRPRSTADPLDFLRKSPLVAEEIKKIEDEQE